MPAAGAALGRVSPGRPAGYSRARFPIAAPSASLPQPDDLLLAPTYIGTERGTKNTPNRPREILALPGDGLLAEQLRARHSPEMKLLKTNRTLPGP